MTYKTTLTGRRAIRVTGAVHPGRPRLRGGRGGGDGGDGRGDVLVSVRWVGDGGSGGGGGRDRSGRRLRVGTPGQVDGRAGRLGGRGRRRPRALVGFAAGDGGGRGSVMVRGAAVMRPAVLRALLVMVAAGGERLPVGMVVVVVVRTGERGRLGRAAELRPQYVVYAELEWPFRRAVQPASARRGRHAVVVTAVLVVGRGGGGGYRLADRLQVVVRRDQRPAIVVPERQLHRGRGRGLGAAVQAAGHHGDAVTTAGHRGERQGASLVGVSAPRVGVRAPSRVTVRRCLTMPCSGASRACLLDAANNVVKRV